MDNILGLFFVITMLAGLNGLCGGKKNGDRFLVSVSFGLFIGGLSGFLYVLFEFM